MMAKTDDLPRGSALNGPAARLALAALAGTGLLFCLGIAVGVTAAFVERGSVKPLALAIAAAALAVAALCGWALYRLKPFAREEGPIAPRVLKARRTLIASGLIGGVLGVVLSVSTLSLDNPWGLFGNTPVPPIAAALALGVWLIVVPLLSWRWWRNIDEHEAAAYSSGAVAGIYAYAFLTPSWWMAWRGGFLPEPQPMLIFAAVMAVWGIAWMNRRSA
jgi:hypothetical protein